MLQQVCRIWSAVRNNLIASREPIRAASRIVWWQFRRRLTQEPMRISFVNGTQLLVYPKRTSSTAVWYLRLPDPDEMLFALHLLRSGDVFVDGGANIGAWSVLAGSTGADVVSVEPVPSTFSVLERQVGINQFAGSVKLVQAALAASRGTVQMTIERDAVNKVIDAGGFEVPTVTLDQLVPAGPTMIKLDLEGYELEAIRGAARTLTSKPLLALVVETFRKQNWKLPKLIEIEQILADAGFLPYSYDPIQRILIPLRGLEAEPEQTGNNTIYVRDTTAVVDRLRTAPKIRIGRTKW